VSRLLLPIVSLLGSLARLSRLSEIQTGNQTEILSLYNETKSDKEVKAMPTLRHLLEELEELGVEPRRIRIPGQLYDSMVADAEEFSEQNPEDEE